jgi:hypothetical protein
VKSDIACPCGWRTVNATPGAILRHMQASSYCRQPFLDHLRRTLRDPRLVDDLAREVASLTERERRRFDEDFTTSGVDFSEPYREARSDANAPVAPIVPPPRPVRPPAVPPPTGSDGPAPDDLQRLFEEADRQTRATLPSTPPRVSFAGVVLLMWPVAELVDGLYSPLGRVFGSVWPLCVFTLVFAYSIALLVRAATAGHGGDRQAAIDPGYEWRLVGPAGRPGGRWGPATEQDVYDHFHGPGAWQKRTWEDLRGSRRFGTLIALLPAYAAACLYVAFAMDGGFGAVLTRSPWSLALVWLSTTALIALLVWRHEPWQLSFAPTLLVTFVVFTHLCSMWAGGMDIGRNPMAAAAGVYLIAFIGLRLAFVEAGRLPILPVLVRRNPDQPQRESGTLYTIVGIAGLLASASVLSGSNPLTYAALGLFVTSVIPLGVLTTLDRPQRDDRSV